MEIRDIYPCKSKFTALAIAQLLNGGKSLYQRDLVTSAYKITLSKLFSSNISTNYLKLFTKQYYYKTFKQLIATSHTISN